MKDTELDARRTELRANAIEWVRHYLPLKIAGWVGELAATGDAYWTWPTRTGAHLARPVALTKLPADRSPTRGSEMSSYKTARAAVHARDTEQQVDAGRLREFPTFAKFSDDALHRLVQAAHRTSTSGPWPLIREQTPSDSCYILLSGEAAVYIGRNRVAVVGPGEVIGESALRRGRLRNATVTTTGRAEVLHIARDDLEVLLQQIPALRETMDATAAKHMPVGAGGELR